MLNDVGCIQSLFISIPRDKNRKEQISIYVDTEGIRGDKFYAKDIARSVLITSLESYLLAKKEQITIPYGALGENLLIDYNPYHLAPSSRLKIGSAILEISQYCTICNHLSSIDKRVPDLLKNDRGIFAKVIQEGEIKKGDTITLLR